MECGREDASFLHQYGMVLAFGQHLHAFADALNTRSANEDHLQRSAIELRGSSHDRTVNLASVSVALNGDVEYAQALLLRIHDILCQQDRPGTRTERRLLRDKIAQFIEKSFAFQKLQKR